MARKVREWFPGAVYHVMTRGNRKEVVFRDRWDYLRYLAVLLEVVERFGVRVHGFCLMPNHVHLHVETGAVPLATVMKVLNQTFSVYVNKRYGLVGHLFQGRYKAILVKETSYELAMSRYIHLNPVDAMIVSEASKYEWSSYNYYVGGDWFRGFHSDFLIRKIVRSDRILNYFQGDKEKYRVYVEGVDY